jgi:polar amino acid transport system substrate-binding protein
MKKKISIILLMLFLLLPVISLAEDIQENKETEKEKLVVDVAQFEPMVMKNGGHGNNQFYGFEIELWNAIAEELNLDFKYQEVKFKNIFDGLKRGESSAALAGITITSAREKNIDFSHPDFSSGLQILVRNENETNIPGIITSVFTKQNIKIAFFFCLFIFIMSQLFWWLEKGNGQISPRYAMGTFDASYYAVVTSATLGYGDIVPKKFSSRMVAIIIIFSGIAFFNYFQAQITSSFTVQKMEYSISHHKQLRGKKVGTKANTTSVDVLKSYGANVSEFEEMEDAYVKLEKKELDAVVFDAPGVMHYANGKGSGKVAVVGNVFEKQYYGIAFQQGSELREKVNRVLLKFRENGVYEKIYKKWFGEN